jgi:transposase
LINTFDKIDNKLKERFFNKVKYLDNGCHIWFGCSYTNKGKTYGYFNFYGKIVTAHRFAWIMANAKDIPKGLCICHHCDNGLCVNPKHLFLGTQKDNVLDMVNKERYGNSAKITKEQVREIYELYDNGLTIKEISKKFPISEGTIFKILSGIRWRNIFENDNRKYKKTHRLNNIQLLKICSLLAKGVKNIEIAKIFNIHESLVSSIKHGYRHKNLYFNYCMEDINE